MTILRMDHVGIVVEDLEAAVAFFETLGLELDGTWTVDGEAVDGVVGLEGVHSEVAMLRTPDGQARIELSKFRSPVGPAGDPRVPANAPGIRHVTFEVEGIDDVLERLRRHRAELVGELVQYEESWRLCYVRGPDGIIVELAERLS